MWDAEGGLGMFGQSNTTNSFSEDLLNTSPATETFILKLCLQRFIQSPEWRLLYADRLRKHLFNGGVLSAASGQARWNSLRDQVKSAIQAIQGSAFYEGHWNNWVNRTPTYLSQCQALGLWPAIMAPGISPFGGTVAAGGTVTVGNVNGYGTLYVTIDGSDPRLPGGAVGPAAFVYSAPLSVTQPLTVKARVRFNTEWSPLTEASFAPPPPRVLITEINYNPPGPDDETEFVEITNVGGGAVSLDGARFTSGIGFTFGNLTLAAGQRVVICRDAAAFAAAWPGVTPAGVYSGGLRNSGDTLTLVDLTGAVITSVSYGDSAPWTPLADGEGSSLVLMRPETVANGNDAANWRASVEAGGNPAGSDVITFPAGADINGDSDRDGWPALVEHALATSDTDAASFPEFAAGADAGGVIVISVERHLGAEDTALEAVTSTDLATWTPATLVSDTAMLNGRSAVTWHAGDAGDSGSRKVFVRVRVSRRP
jgi:hypothetical protein